MKGESKKMLENIRGNGFMKKRNSHGLTQMNTDKEIRENPCVSVAKNKTVSVRGMI